MVQGYYTLDESAGILGISADELKLRARKGEIRSFQDRGTWRFRIQDVQEMARRTGKGSDPEMPLADVPKPKPTDSPSPRSPSPQKKKEDDVFAFSLGSDEEDDAGINLAAAADRQIAAKGSKSSKKPSSKSKVAPKEMDSDIRLVADGSDVTFSIAADSDVKVAESGVAPKSVPRSGTGLPGPNSPRPSKLAQAETRDSGVRLVPLDSDSDVRIVGPGSDEFDVPIGANPPKGATDSDVRLEVRAPSPPPSSEPEGLLTEEINLDEELKKDEAQRQAQMRQAKLRPKEPKFPTRSPFELSESDIDLPPEDETPKAQVKKDESSSDFELKPAREDSSDFDLTPSADSSSLGDMGVDDFRLEVPDEDDQATLADDGNVSLRRPNTGINLDKPADSGISLEQAGESDEEVDFALTLDAESTPQPLGSRPSTPKPSAGAPIAEPESESEFELSLDLEGPQKTGSDSEFELTLDDAGLLEPLEEDDAPAAKKGREKDIFETDFDVPGLEEDSGSSAVVMEDGDTELESSDFELAIGEEDAAAESDDSGSMVVPLDEEELLEEAEEPAPTKGKKKKQAKKGGKKPARAADEFALDDAGFGDLDAGEPMVEAGAEADEDEDAGAGGTRVVRETVVLQQAPWGVFPTLVLFPCIVVMVLLGIMGVELVQQQQGYKPGFLTKAIAGMIDKKK